MQIAMIMPIEFTNTIRGKKCFPQRRQNEFQKMIPGSNGAIVKGYKIGVTKWLRQNQTEDFPSGQPVWQRNYYEHIIRNEKAFYSISDYIMNNPANWNNDQLFSL